MTTTSPTLTTSMPSPIPVGELAYARAFLVARQVALYLTRRLCTEDVAQGDVFRKLDIWNAEKQVLAALSWVWDAQERAHDTRSLVTVSINFDAGEMKRFFDKASKSLAARMMPNYTAQRAEMARRHRELVGEPKKRSRARAKAA